MRAWPIISARTRKHCGVLYHIHHFASRVFCGSTFGYLTAECVAPSYRCIDTGYFSQGIRAIERLHALKQVKEAIDIPALTVLVKVRTTRIY